MSGIRPIDYFDQGVALAPDRSCLRHHDTEYSYGEVQDITWRIANALKARKITKNDKIAVFSPNDADGFICLLSILRLGAVWVNMNAMNSEDENCRYLKKTDTDVLFIHSKFYPLLDKIREKCPHIRLFIGIDEPSHHIDFTYIQLCEEGKLEEFTVEAKEEDLCSLFPTGGTTGDPKAVMFTNKMWTTMISTFVDNFPRKSPPVHLLIAPMTHGAGGITLCLMAYGTSHILMDNFNLDIVMPLVAEEKVTHLFLPPTAIYSWLARTDVREYDYSSLDYILTGSAPMAVGSIKEALDIFGPVIAQTYGQSEAPLVCTIFTSCNIMKAVEKYPERLKSCGKKSDCTTLAIMDEKGQILTEGEKGQIVVKGDLVTPGYYRNISETKKLDMNGWHQTGDIGYIDADGYVYIIDRLKEMIITGGFNVFPSEVENIIQSHGAVLECAVIGIPHDIWGEEVRAIVKLKPNKSLSEEDLISYCKRIIGSVRTPKVVEFWEDLPKNASGKILRKDIRAPYWKSSSRSI